MVCEIQNLSDDGGSIGGQFGDTITPTQIGNIVGTSTGSIAGDLNGRLFYSVGTSVINTYDCSDPSNPTLIASVSASPFVLNVRGKYLYALNPFQNSLNVYDITEPKFITLVNTISGSGFWYSTTTYGPYLIVSTLLSGIFIYDNCPCFSLSHTFCAMSRYKVVYKA